MYNFHIYCDRALSFIVLGWCDLFLTYFVYFNPLSKQDTFFLFIQNMSPFVPGSDNMRKALIFCYHLNKRAADSH